MLQLVISRKSLFLIAFLFLILLPVNARVSAQNVVSGYLDDDSPEDAYPIELLAGQQVIVKTEAISGDLDTVIRLESPTGEILIENDDMNDTSLNSYLSFRVDVSGEYTVVISNFPQTAGEYVMSIVTAAPNDQASGETEVVTGFMSDTTPDAEVPVRLRPNEAVIVMAEGEGDLDTYLYLLDDTDAVVAENDDRTYDELNSEIVYISETGGNYTIVMSNYPDTSGDYHLTVSVVAAEDIPLVLRFEFSGPAQYYDTPHFRIHYTLEGLDATTESYVREVAKVMEEVRTIQVEQLGWPEPLQDGIIGGDDRFDVYIVDIITEELGGHFGVAVVEPPFLDDLTTEIEESVSAGFILLDNDYALSDQVPADIMRASAAHEYHHAIQFTYDAIEPYSWYLEATAAWMEIQTYPEEQAATGYIEDLFWYPEICFGASDAADPTDGLLQYGYWLFLESLVEAHGERFIYDLWDEIMTGSDWEPLEVTLERYGETIPDAMTRFHIQNLVRDYEVAPLFSDYTVWQEDAITRPGSHFRRRGSQELGANYYALALRDESFSVRLIDDDSRDLMLWLIGIEGNTAEAYQLNASSVIDPDRFDYLYLMVFNPTYDDDVSECDYSGYRFAITLAEGENLPQPAYRFYTGNFAPLEE